MKKRYLSLAIIVVLVVGAVAGAYLRFASQRVAAQSASDLPMATVQRGTLAATVNAAGNIAPAQEVTLNFQQTGTVSKINVQVGDQVKTGQVLAELDNGGLTLQLQNAQIDLKNAQDKLVQAKNPSTQQDIANAQAALDSAKASYNKLVAGASAADIAAAQAGVASAQAAYNAALKTAGAGDNQLQVAAAAVESAQAALQTAQAAYDRVKSDPNIGMMAQSTTLQQATIAYQSALASYQQLQATSATNANSTVQQAKAQLQQAQTNLANLKNQVNQNDVIASQALVTQAQNNLDKLLAGPDTATLDEAQNAVDQAQIALKQAQLAVQQAQIVAPFDGVVTAVNITLGESASTASGAIQLADLNHLEIVVDMAEVDVPRIQVGQGAQISLDALPDAQLTGQVAEISPAGVLTQGVVNYPVTVALADPGAGVLTGMTANVNIVTDQRDNVLMVPNRAVHTQGRQKLVTVLFEGQQMQVPVQTGLSNDTMTEITSGLNEGDTVLLTSTGATANTQFRGGPGFIGGFGR